MTNTIAKERAQVIFCVKETTKGTAVFPTAAAQKIVATGPVKLNQPLNKTNSKEIADTLDVTDRFAGQLKAGTFEIPLYLCPSGTAGVAPMGGVLFESAYGVETIVGSTSVTYSQSKTKPSFTTWFQQDHTVYFGTGCCAEGKKLDTGNEDAVGITFTGGFMLKGWAGTSAVVGAVAAAKAVTVTTGEGKLFTAGGYVSFGSDTNTNAGYKIASVSGDVLTMVDDITCDSGVEVKGFLPTFTRVGAPIENKNRTITFDGSAKVLNSFSVDYRSPVKWQDEEMTASGHTEDYVENERSINLSVGAVFRRTDVGYNYDALNDTKVAVVVAIANGAGKICTFNYPYTEFDMPENSSSKPTINITMSGMALGSSGEDSSTIVFT